MSGMVVNRKTELNDAQLNFEKAKVDLESLLSKTVASFKKEGQGGALSALISEALKNAVPSDTLKYVKTKI